MSFPRIRTGDSGSWHRSRIRALRWIAPVAVLGVLTAAVLLPSTTTTANAHPELAARSAAQLLADVAGSRVSALSGTVVATARLGLPQLPAQSSTGTSSPLALISGSHTLKVWLDGPQRQRMAMISQLAEYDVVHNGRDVWTYTSESNAVTHAVLPALPAAAATSGGGSGAAGDPRSYVTPGAAADTALKAVGPTTVVGVDRSARVAGRPAYQLVLTPRDHASLVTSVKIAIDSATKTPLRVQVWGSRDAGKPALEVGFTDVRFRRPAASVFAFTAPPGAKVNELRIPAPSGTPRSTPHPDAAPQVVGTGWTAVVVLKTGSSGQYDEGGPSAALLDKVTTRVPEGQLLKTTLFSVLLTHDGRLLAGAVAPERVQKVAATSAQR